MDVIKLSKFDELNNNKVWYALEKYIHSFKSALIVNDTEFKEGVFYSSDVPHLRNSFTSGFMFIYLLDSPLKRYTTLSQDASAPDNVIKIPKIFVVDNETHVNGYLRIFFRRRN
jgi:hypothetical protein